MTGALQASNRPALTAALGWLVDAGVDTIVGDAPFDWLGAREVAATPAPARATPDPQPRPTASALSVGVDSLAALTAAVAEFDARPAGTPAMPPLFADGEPARGVMVVGDRPTQADAAAGRMFSDAAGALLDRMLAGIGRSRDTTYLANLVPWPTPADRPASADEIAALAPFLHRQIALARPKALLALGQAAANALCGTNAGINRLRGRWQMVAIDGLTVAVMPTFHPTHLLNMPAHKALAWADLCAFRARLAELRIDG